MQMRKQDKPQCLLYSFAMALDTTPDLLIKEVGHDGLPNGFHYREFYQSCIDRGYFPSFVELYPQLSTKPGEPIWDDERCRQEMFALTYGKNCVLFTENHAVALSDYGIIYDPNGKVYSYDLSIYYAAVILSNQITSKNN